METPENREYVVWFIEGVGVGRRHAALSVYKRGVSPLRSDACVYRIKGEGGVLKKSYTELLAVMQLAGETMKSGDIRCELDRESILAVVPSWRNVI